MLLWRIRQVMAEFPRDYHLLVLDDGSTDDTEDVLAPYVQVLPLTVLRNERREGYARSLDRLVREAVRRATHPRRDMVVTLQADFTEAPEDIPSLIRRMEGGADVVTAAVVEHGEEQSRLFSWARKGIPWLLRRRLLPEVRDPLSGFRAYRVSSLKRALAERGDDPLLTREGWLANAELLMSVIPHARRMEEAEVSMRPARRQRPTRFHPWSTVRELWSFARATRPLAPSGSASEGAD